MNDLTKERADFEAAYLAHYGPRPRVRSVCEAEWRGWQLARAALSTPAQAVPGFMLAPVEPTRQMYDAGGDVDGTPDKLLRAIYQAMLAARPQQPAQAVPEPVPVALAKAMQCVCDDPGCCAFHRRCMGRCHEPLTNANTALRLRATDEQAAMLAAAPQQPGPSEVWEASSKTTTMLFASKADADQWLAQFSPAVSGGFEVVRREVYRTGGQPGPAVQGEALSRAWDDLPDALKAHPGVKALHRAAQGGEK